MKLGKQSQNDDGEEEVQGVIVFTISCHRHRHNFLHPEVAVTPIKSADFHQLNCGHVVKKP
jgi:hypothetical protein